MKPLRLIVITASLLVGSALAVAPSVDQLQSRAAEQSIRGDFEAALVDWTTIAGLQQREGDVPGESRSSAQLAEATLALGQDETALMQLEHARALAEQVDDPAWHATLLGVLGGAYTRAGLLDQAEQSLYDGLQLRKRHLRAVSRPPC